MSIILTILKIIGIAILIILGIVIALILLVLFVPLRYKARGTYLDAQADISGKVRWLLGTVSVNVQYQSGEPFHIKAKVFFITVFDNLKERKKPKKERKRKRVSDEEPQLQAASSSEEEIVDNEAVQEDTVVKENETVSEENKKAIEAEEDLNFMQDVERTADEVEIDKVDHNTANDEQTDKPTVFEKIKAFFEKIVEAFRNIKFTFHKIYDIIVKIRDNIKYYWELLQQESTKQAFRLCSTQLFKIIKSIAPKKYEVKLHLGFEDPATMGNVLAVWGMSYPFHMGKVDIQPEFDKKITEGTFRLKGKISVYVFLWTAWLLLTDKNIKRLRKQLNL